MTPIQGRLLTLRHYEEKRHFAYWWRFVHDPSIRAYIDEKFSGTEDGERERLRHICADPRNWLLFYEVHEHAHIPIGATLVEFRPEEKCFFTGPTFIGDAILRGSGYATDAKHALFDLLFAAPFGYARTRTEIYEINTHCIRHLEKLGYQRVSSFVQVPFPHSLHPEKDMMPIIVMELSRQEFLKKKNFPKV